MRIPPARTDPNPSPNTHGAAAKDSIIAVLVAQALDDLAAARLDLPAALRLVGTIAWHDGYAAGAAG
jgi:hypothetical protein